MSVIKLLALSFSVLLFITYNNSVSEEYSYGDWLWSNSEPELFYAATVNANNHIFGQYCLIKDASCFYAADIGATCEVGKNIDVLINSDKGSIKTELYCVDKFEQSSALAFANFKDIDLIVKNASRIGVAVALNDGAFKVVRFSLSGSKHTIHKMRNSLSKYINKKKNNKINLPADEIL